MRARLLPFLAALPEPTSGTSPIGLLAAVPRASTDARFFPRLFKQCQAYRHIPYHEVSVCSQNFTFREYSLLDNPRTPASVKDGQVRKQVQLMGGWYARGEGGC